ncbi:uncharacterized protein LOC142104253 isoform X1 [Mixophyes fleayi]|uniref:uncharacterized protein LOC142104253 isoform X1 n=1 Tax=Mixophyes fleayi TaxID=3061075 RepID=UPI003F4E2F5A
MMFFCFFALHLVVQNFVFGNLIVTQAPKQLTLHKGDPATMTCHWTIGDDTQIRVEWTRSHMSMTGPENKTVLSSLIWTIENTRTPTERRNNTIYNITNNAAMMTMDSVTETDDGLYICEIIIEKPMFNKGKGNGTLLKVQEYGRGYDISTVGRGYRRPTQVPCLRDECIESATERPVSFIDYRYGYLFFLLIIPIMITVYCRYHKRKKKGLHLDHTYGNVTRRRSKTKKSTSSKCKNVSRKTVV